MSVVVVGLRERDASLDLLAGVAVDDDALPKALAELASSPHLAEAVVVSTCLRTEVYAVTERFHDGVDDIHRFFANRLGDASGSEEIADRLFVAFDEAAAQHLFSVASGIDSPVLGEGEVLRQVRHALERARAERSAGPILDGLFRHALSAGKRARTETAIARGITSLSHVAVALAVAHFGGSLADRRVLLAGAGEMGSGIADALGSAPGAPEVVLANRRPDRAAVLARRLGARVVGLDALEVELGTADVLITALSTPTPLVGAPLVGRARAGAGPLLVIDAGLPRNVDQAVGDLPGVGVVDLDDLRRYAESVMAQRRSEVSAVERILAEELERYRTSARSREMAPLVQALRTRGEEVLRTELARARGKLERLEPTDAALVEQVARAVVAKLLHEPTVQLKQAAGTARGERLAEALRGLFDL